MLPLVPLVLLLRLLLLDFLLLLLLLFEVEPLLDFLLPLVLLLLLELPPHTNAATAAQSPRYTTWRVSSQQYHPAQPEEDDERLRLLELEPQHAQLAARSLVPIVSPHCRWCCRTH